MNQQVSLRIRATAFHSLVTITIIYSYVLHNLTLAE